MIPVENDSNKHWGSSKLPVFKNNIDPANYWGLVYRAAKILYAPEPIKDSDLFAEGLIGLIKAIRHFDPNNGCPFSIYATRWIRSFMLEWIKKENSASRNYGVRPALFSDLIRSDVTNIVDVFQSKELESYEVCIRGEHKTELEKLFGILPERITIAMNRYIAEGCTLAEVGKELGVSREAVRRMVGRGLFKIRENLALNHSKGNIGKKVSGKVYKTVKR